MLDDGSGSQPNFIIMSDDEQAKFAGAIRAKEADYAFITPDDAYPDVFIHRSNISDGKFDDLNIGSPITFAVGFSTKGATGLA
jgi:cold shock CspA family protein